MVLIVNTTSDRFVTTELKKQINSKGIDAEIIETDAMHIIGLFELLHQHGSQLT